MPVRDAPSRRQGRRVDAIEVALESGPRGDALGAVLDRRDRDANHVGTTGWARRSRIRDAARTDPSTPRTTIATPNHRLLRSAPTPEPGGWMITRRSGERLVTSPRASAAEPYRELIADALDRGRNAMVIWQEPVDEQGFTGGYASVRRLVARLRGQVGRATIRARTVSEYAFEHAGARR